MIRPVLFVVLMTTTVPLTAQAPMPAPTSQNLSAVFLTCYQRAGDNVVQRSVCASREAGSQDDRLNKAYQRVMHQLASDPAAHADLRADERRWIQERDYRCKVNGQTTDSACVVIMTANRADDLERRVRF